MFGRPFFGRGMFYGPGHGYGAILGYCPYTGLPRGWRFNPYYYGNMNYFIPNYQNYPNPPYYNIYAPVQNNINEKEMLENELKYLQERMEQIQKRLKEIE